MKRTFLWAMVIMAVISIACASGGGGTHMPVEEVRELLTAYAGQWELDQSSAPSQRARLEPPPMISVDGTNRASVRAQARMEAEAAQRLMAIQQETFRIFNLYPRTLVLQVDGDSLAYRPTPGPSSMLPLDGGSIARSGTERNISTRINWDVQRLEFTHQVESTGRVSEVLRTRRGPAARYPDGSCSWPESLAIRPDVRSAAGAGTGGRIRRCRG